jgi:YVTN family beta-propeller protein
MKIKALLSVACLMALISSCKKDNDGSSETPVVTTGVYVLNEGNFGLNNTTLSYYSFSTNTATTDYYQNVNSNGLGDTGNDILLYGGKMYIVMNVSSYVQVADALTAKAIKRIEFEITAGGAKRQPRYAVPYKNKVLVSSYDGTIAVIDTTSLTIEQFAAAGSNPDGLAVWGDKLYVANSGGLNYPVFDSTVSVIDLTTMTETQKIKVGVGPGPVTTDSSGNIYVICYGNYNDKLPSLVKINAATNTVIKSADTAVGKLRYYNGLLYATPPYGSSNVRTLSTTDFSQTSSNFVKDGTKLTAPYGITVDATSGDVYVADAIDYTSSGTVYCFDKSGNKKFSFSVSPGINPSKIALIKQ